MLAVYCGNWDCGYGGRVVVHLGEGAYYAKIIAVSQCGEGVSKVKTPRSNSYTAPNALAQVVCRFDGSYIDRY